MAEPPRRIENRIAHVMSAFPVQRRRPELPDRRVSGLRKSLPRAPHEQGGPVGRLDEAHFTEPRSQVGANGPLIRRAWVSLDDGNRSVGEQLIEERSDHRTADSSAEQTWL